MLSYLVDTNICVYLLRGRYHVDRKLEDVGSSNCGISEITIAELKFGAANSDRVSRQTALVNGFGSSIEVVPMDSSFEVYAHEKARLRKQGQIIDDFDLVIGATAIVNDLILVTNNEKHFFEAGRNYAGTLDFITPRSSF